MTVWIVLKNGDVDEVFDNEDAARYHALQLRNKWNVAEVIEREVNIL